MAAGDLTTLDRVRRYLRLKGKPITGITKANPGVVTCVGHGLLTGQVVGLLGINGTTQLNGQSVTITVVDANSFSIGVDTSTYGAYTSGGYVSDSDPLLTDLITSVSNWVKTYCNRDFSVPAASYTEVLDGTGNARQMVGQFPVTGVTSVSFAGVAQHITGLVFNGRALTFTDGTVWAKGKSNVTVTYTAGLSSIPADLEEAVVEIVAWRYTETSRVQQKSKAVGQETITFDSAAMPQSAMTTLNQLRSVVPV